MKRPKLDVSTSLDATTHRQEMSLANFLLSVPQLSFSSRDSLPLFNTFSSKRVREIREGSRHREGKSVESRGKERGTRRERKGVGREGVEAASEGKGKLWGCEGLECERGWEVREVGGDGLG